MKCPSCGAEIGANSKFCEACGSQISYEMRREQEQVNKQGCPKCGSSSIKFTRENQGEVRGKNSKRIVHRTVGYCQDCGYTWYPSGANEAPQKNNMVWWVLGWIFFFPAPVMVLIWRKKNTWDIKIKIAVTVVFWVLIFALGSCSDSSEGSSKDTEMTKVEETTSNDNLEQQTTDDKSNDEVVEQTTTKDTASDKEDEPNQYSEDDKVNQFITEYNAVTRYEMTDFSKGNIRSKMFGHTNDCYVEMLNPASTSGYSFIVTINGGNNEEITEKMNEVFPDFVHTLDNSISDEQIEEAITAFKNDPSSRKEYKLGDDLTIDYYPLVFKDDGSWLASSRIEISSLNYGN